MLLKYSRATIAFAHDLVMAALSFLIALYLRLGSDFIVFFQVRYLVLGTVVFTLVAAGVFLSQRLYRGVWRYASLNDLLAITKAATLVILIFFGVMFLFTRLEDLPRSTLLINWFVLMALLGAPRFLYRLFKDRRLELKMEHVGVRRIPVLLAGAGDNAELFIRAMSRNPDAPYRIVGLLSRSDHRVGRLIHDKEVLGTLDDLDKVTRKLALMGDKPQRLILTSSEFEGAQVRALLERAEALGLTLARLPELTDFKAGVKDEVEVKPIAVEDLLNRPQAVLDRPAMAALIRGKRVLITGAGGSIGSELVRQVSDLEPAEIALLDASEFNLYAIDMELSERHKDLPRRALLADVRDGARIERVFGEVKPDLVFHAAALKHVPMVEMNPFEGVRTNVLGSRIIADACRTHGVEQMVLISTDKAVNPTNVMGATKRVAECYAQALDRLKERTHFVTVRFGNVLGSTGSVVPLFQKQLARGGPLTVTHPEVTRYFMTIREAVELVLQASVLGHSDETYRGKIFVLDMGEPVKIIDLARQMIRLAGLRPDQDVKIEITGLRPGEKLYEEILHDEENSLPTPHSGIFVGEPRTAELETITKVLEHLGVACAAADKAALTQELHTLVPEFSQS
ncbi:MAG: nucleotide sugar dehydratase [Alphaproteobacteria bacterium RIFOXYD12_FULL_60_8]|nr:MAG: nucleotide sugar dehydratase [Alphaproteobacteria bacterium RIFOXYD12_FULL_60_8]